MKNMNTRFIEWGLVICIVFLVVGIVFIGAFQPYGQAKQITLYNISTINALAIPLGTLLGALIGLHSKPKKKNENSDENSQKK